MAIDTENKRRSVSGYTSWVIYPIADGSINARDREHSAWLYAGIAAPAPPISTLVADDGFWAGGIGIRV